MARVHLDHLTKVYASRNGSALVAVDDLQCEIADGELMVLAGPVGSGKSTTLRMIAGLEKPTRGEIIIGDRRMSDIAPAERNVATVLQNAGLYPHMTAFENLAFGLKLRNYSRAEIKRRIDDAAGALGIEPLLEQKPKAISRLDRRRVVLARAVVRQPRVILLDDPLAAIEPEEGGQLRAEIFKLRQRSQATVIYATSDPSEALSLADRIILLKKGRVEQIESPMRLYREPSNLFAGRFFGDPPMNVIEGSVRSERGRRFFREGGDGTIRLPLPLETPLVEMASVLLGLRPEDLEVTQRGADSPGFPVIIDRIEPKGPDTLLHVQTGAHDLACRSRDDWNAAETGRRVQLSIDPAKAHFFAPETSERLA